LIYILRSAEPMLGIIPFRGQARETLRSLPL
jgi:hypothetical protein